MYPPQAAISRVKRRLTVTFDVAGVVNPRYYYFIAIDTQGDAGAGPVPVVTYPWGNGWVTGRVTHFIEYHLGRYEVDRFRDNTDLLAWDPLGPPFEYNRPENPPGNRIQVTLDVDATLGKDVQRINMNLITTDQIQIEPQLHGTKLYDGLGATGNSLVNIPLISNQTFTNSEAIDPEGPGDLPPQPAPDVTVNDLDITDWTAEVRVL